MKLLLKIAFFVIIAFMTSCYYDSEEKLYPPLSGSCDLSNVTFAATVTPILQASCFNCHSNATAANSGGGIKIQNYADVVILVNNGRLMGSITHASGYQAMPLGGGKLTDCEISKLQTWIDNGKLNN